MSLSALRRALISPFRSEASPQMWWPIETASAEPTFEPYNSYFRLWLADMSLARDRDWFVNRYPAVHAAVRLRFAGGEPVTFATLSRPATDAIGRGVFQNFPLTPPLPYQGGTIEIEAGLTALKSSNPAIAGFETLCDLSGLIGPPLTQALGIARIVATGGAKMRAAAGARALLGLHYGFAPIGADDTAIRPGYRALVKATEDEIDPAALRVENGRLRVLRGGESKPLVKHDYMLFRIESQRERDNWKLPQVDELIRSAKQAHFRGERRTCRGYRAAAITAVMTSADPTAEDQQRAARVIAAELDAAVSGALGAVDTKWPDLAEIIESRAPDAYELLHTQRLTLEQLPEE